MRCHWWKEEVRSVGMKGYGRDRKQEWTAFWPVPLQHENAGGLKQAHPLDLISAPDHSTPYLQTSPGHHQTSNLGTSWPDISNFVSLRACCV